MSPVQPSRRRVGGVTAPSRPLPLACCCSHATLAALERARPTCRRLCKGASTVLLNVKLPQILLLMRCAKRGNLSVKAFHLPTIIGVRVGTCVLGRAHDEHICTSPSPQVRHPMRPSPPVVFESFRSPWNILRSSLHCLFSPSCYYDLDVDPELRHRFTLRQGHRRAGRSSFPLLLWPTEGDEWEARETGECLLACEFVTWRNVG